MSSDLANLRIVEELQARFAELSARLAAEDEPAVTYSPHIRSTEEISDPAEIPA